MYYAYSIQSINQLNFKQHKVTCRKTGAIIKKYTINTLYMYYENRTRGTQRKVQKKRVKTKKAKSKKVQLITNTCTSCQA